MAEDYKLIDNEEKHRYEFQIDDKFTLFILKSPPLLEARELVLNLQKKYCQILNDKVYVWYPFAHL